MDSNRFEKLQKQYRKSKKLLNVSLEKLLEESPNFNKVTLNDVHSKCITFFSEFELYLTNVSSLEEELSKTQIHDVLTTIENILVSSIEYWETISSVSEQVLGFKIEPEQNCLKTSQAILRTHNRKKALEVKNLFVEAKLPIEGFSSKEKCKLNSIKVDKVSLFIGIVLLTPSSIVVFLDLIDTGMQYFFVRILISLGFVLLITGTFKSSIQAKIKIPGAVVNASGTIAVFLVLYFFNPAEAPKYEKLEKVNIEKPFLIGKEINTPLLIRLTQIGANDGHKLQKLSYNPVYLNVDFFDSINLYKEIENKEAMKNCIELQSILEEINIKVKNLHNANLSMQTGDLQSIQTAIMDFVIVHEKAQRALYLYHEVTKLIVKEKSS